MTALAALLAAAVQGLAARPADLVSPAQEAAYAAELRSATLNLGAMRRRAPCPAEASVHSLGVTRLGTAGALLGASPADPIDPGAGVYKEHVRIDGCGEQARGDNILTLRQKDGRWLTMPMFPGDSRTTPVQQHDALQAALQLIQLSEPRVTCAPGQPGYLLLDTQVTDLSQVDKGVWTERWIQQACGQDRTVELTFMPRPDGKATSVIANQAWPGTKASAGADPRRDGGVGSGPQR